MSDLIQLQEISEISELLDVYQRVIERLRTKRLSLMNQNHGYVNSTYSSASQELGRALIEQHLLKEQLDQLLMTKKTT